MKSIQTKLIVVILGIFLVAMVILGGLNYWWARNIIVGDISTNMSGEAANAADSVASWLKIQQSELTGLTMASAIQGGNSADIGKFLAGVKRESNSFEVLDYATPDGAYVNSVGSTGNIGQRSYFQQALKGEVAVSDPLISVGTGHLVTMVAVPVKVNGQVVGVLAGGVNMEDVTKKILSIKIGQTGYAYVVQGDGLVVIHPNKEIAMQANVLKENNGFPPSLRAIGEHMIKSETGITSYEIGGVEKKVAFAPVAGTQWSLALTVPTAEVTSGVSTLTKVSVITIIVVLIVTGLFIARFSRSLVKPIQDLEVIAKQIAAGDLSVTKVDISRRPKRLIRLLWQLPMWRRERMSRSKPQPTLRPLWNRFRPVFSRLPLMPTRLPFTLTWLLKKLMTGLARWGKRLIRWGRSNKRSIPQLRL
ncbi:MAG: mcpA 6 [Firmicutes bacterium]|nr:mcpA 6 [Bacillota bacterium]